MFGRLAAVLTLSAVACAAAAPSTAATVPGASGREYVALGDSYTAAPLVPPEAPASPALCARSGGNYPHILAARLHLLLTDVSCAAANSHDLDHPRSVDIPAQIAALSPTTSIVTVGIGGNDHNLFASVITGCGSSAPLVLAGSAAPCRDAYADRYAEIISADAEAIRGVLQEIHVAAPNAKVLVVGYPSLLPTDSVSRAACILGGIPFTPDDMAFLDGVERSLNAMLAAAAGATGSRYVDTYTASKGHDMCQLPGVRWIEPLFPASRAAPVHPNAAGQAATARAVARHLP